MRRKEPNAFERHALDSGEPAQCDAFAVLSIEIRVAERAFAAALGLPDPYPAEIYAKSDDMRQLNDAYQEYGLSTGIWQTEELVRAVERQATRQAVRHRGESR
jgi:hypothetical protein